MGDSLAARACGVDIGDTAGGEDCEGRGGETFGGYVDVCCKMIRKKGEERGSAQPAFQTELMFQIIA